MAKYVDFPLDQSQKIRVEVELPEPLGGALRGGGSRSTQDDVFENSDVPFEATMAKLKPICPAIVKQAREMVEQPEEFSGEFGVKLNAETGVVIEKTAAEANLKISVKWKKGEK